MLDSAYYGCGYSDDTPLGNAPIVNLFYNCVTGEDHLNINKPPALSLTPVQEEILYNYIDYNVTPNFEGFISAAPTAPCDLRPLHYFILNQAYLLPSEIFMALLEKFYIPTSPNNPNFEQNQHLRTFLISFNKLCNEQMDVNLQLFATVFDSRLSPKKNSPAKRRLVADFLKAHIPAELTDNTTFNCFVASANEWLNNYRSKELASPRLTVRRTLNFNCC